MVQIHMMTKIEKELYNLIIKGKVDCVDKNEEDTAIDLLKKSAKDYPDVLWSLIYEAFGYDNLGMAIPAMAAYLTSSTTDNHFNFKIKKYFINLLSTLNPVTLLELTEYIKSKVFGKGLGSRNQKLLQKIIESWNSKTLKEYIDLYPEEVLNLLKILHPKLSDEKNEIIKNIVNKIV